jgi:ADP-ribose pyrophosphatase YjhB (NUDIX family)
MESSMTKPDNEWISWIKELQNLSQCALAYCKDKYDIERFERIREISAEMAAEISDHPLEEIKATFCTGTGYQTPKLDTRSAVFRDGKILLVQEANGSWALPGGWVDYDQTIRTNAVKEVLEEAGMNVEPVRVIALYDHNKRNGTFFPSNVCSAFVLCRYISGDFQPNLETVACRFFGPDELPDHLADGKSNREQILMCFEASEEENWQPIFD